MHQKKEMKNDSISIVQRHLINHNPGALETDGESTFCFRIYFFRFFQINFLFYLAEALGVVDPEYGERLKNWRKYPPLSLIKGANTYNELFIMRHRAIGNKFAAK